MKSILLLISINLFAFLSFCQVKRQNFDLDSTTLYFPLSLFPTFDWTEKYEDSSTVLVYWMTSGEDTTYGYSKAIKNVFDTAQVKRFSKYLFAMKEPLLHAEETKNKETFRFLWLRSFHHPIVIRIEKNNDQYKLNWKITSGLGGYYPGKIKTSKEKIITKQQWDTFIKLVDTTWFWKAKNIGHMLMSDGARWTIEGSSYNKYNVYDGTSPSEECEYLIKLAKIKIKEDDLY